MRDKCQLYHQLIIVRSYDTAVPQASRLTTLYELHQPRRVSTRTMGRDIHTESDDFLASNAVTVGCRHIPHPPWGSLVVVSKSLSDTPKLR